MESRIVCGAGPAGVTTALLHKSSKVIILDSNLFFKPCSERVMKQEAVSFPFVLGGDLDMMNRVEVEMSFKTSLCTQSARGTAPGSFSHSRAKSQNF